MPNRVAFYIDGFNFYNGLRTAKQKNSVWGGYYWIDLVEFCKQFLGEDQELVKVKYFSASPKNIHKRINQRALFDANKLANSSNGTFEIIYGKYKDKPIACKATCKQLFTVPEEKRTDVNISVHLVGDCLLDVVDTVVLISADSDLVPPIEFIKEHCPQKKVKVFFPPERRSADIKNIRGVRVKSLMNNHKQFSAAIMDDTVTKNGQSVTIPAKWLAYKASK